MVDAHIITGFAYGQQWLGAGVTVCVPLVLAKSWVAVGLAQIATNDAPQESPSTQAKAHKVRTKKAA